MLVFLCRCVILFIGVLCSGYVLINEKPPPFWSQRCVAWKGTKDDCNRCCAAYGNNYASPKVFVSLLLLVQFTRLFITGVMCTHNYHPASPKTGASLNATWCLASILGGILKIAALSIPSLLFAPADQKIVWSVIPSLGAAVFIISTIWIALLPKHQSLRSLKAQRTLELLNLCCWASVAGVSMAPRPILYNALDVGKDVSLLMKLSTSGLSAGVALILFVSNMCCWPPTAYHESHTQGKQKHE